MNILINNSCGKPIYTQIEEQIRDSILKNELSINEGLPSIRTLAKELKISVITTKRAYEELERKGFIYTVKGKGSFISNQDTEIIKNIIIKNVKLYLKEGLKEGKKVELELSEMKTILEVIYND
ncbi:GntR family transcriptional regulator [Clostridium ihumii]|uniref:GntR family transcriptional regulator n=1 Tax=Clostridium ihumii TaxID=1470356 RepID=UPI00058F8EBD|nr:GntR family transcriptional regulator [Clostridium ihumii]